MPEVQEEELNPDNPVFFKSEEWTLMLDGKEVPKPVGWYFWDKQWRNVYGPYDNKEYCYSLYFLYVTL